jgi:hypothetical protein
MIAPNPQQPAVKISSASEFIAHIHMYGHTSMSFHPGSSSKLVTGPCLSRNETIDNLSGFASKMSEVWTPNVDGTDCRTSSAAVFGLREIIASSFTHKKVESPQMLSQS